MSYVEWDGQEMARRHASLVHRILEGSRVPLLVAHDIRTFVVWPERIGEFFLVNREWSFACHDVGSLFGDLVKFLTGPGDEPVMAALWDIARRGGPRDIMLLDMLIREATHPSRPDPAKLADLKLRILGQEEALIPRPARIKHAVATGLV